MHEGLKRSHIYTLSCGYTDYTCEGLTVNALHKMTIVIIIIGYQGHKQTPEGSGNLTVWPLCLFPKIISKKPLKGQGCHCGQPGHSPGQLEETRTSRGGGPEPGQASPGVG